MELIWKQRVNRGGFGVVDAVEMPDGILVARKTFDPVNKDIDEETLGKYRKRFIREVKVQEKLSKDLLIPILNKSLEIDSPWFLMPLSEKDFGQEIHNCKQQHTIPDGLADILNSLEYLHSLGYIHRDLKPQNILFHDGKWKLADLGLISADKDAYTTAITSANAKGGTERYCAPEQVSSFKDVTTAADIYSFGAILHDIFGSPDRTPYSQLTCDGPIGLIIEKCTERDPSKRFSSIAALRSTLLKTLAQHNVNFDDDSFVDWQAKVANCHNWNYDEFAKFVMYLKKGQQDYLYILFEIDQSNLEKLKAIDEELWDNLAVVYLDWIRTRGFDFNYCDVLIGHIKHIYDKTSNLKVKCLATIVGADLAESHNRWFVMGKVVSMCSPQIDSMLAQRISIEIVVGGEAIRNHFLACVDRISLESDSYHPAIAEALIDN